MAAAPNAAQQAGRGRFETLNVQQQSAGAAEPAALEREAADAATRLLLPPGFSTEAPTESLAVNGDMANLDRGMMGDRMEAIGRGEFDPATGEFAQGFGRLGPGGPAGPGGFGGRGDGGGRGGPGGPEGRGGPDGREFALAGRGVRQNPYTIQTSYNYGGSALDSAPYQLREDGISDSHPYNRQTFGMTVLGENTWRLRRHAADELHCDL